MFLIVEYRKFFALAKSRFGVFYITQMETEKKSRFNTKGYTFKILLLVFLVLLLLIPLSMIRGIIDDRGDTAKDAEAGIMEAWGSELESAGPFIAVPGTRTEELRTKTERDGEKIEIVKQPFTLIIAPQKLNVGANFSTEIRKRGIFSVPLFSGSLRFSGSFNPAAALSSLQPNEEVSLNQAELIVFLSSQKGIRKIEKALWDAKELFFLPGNQDFLLTTNRNKRFSLNSGVHASLPDFANAESNFDISIAMQGGQLIRFFPAGQDTHVEISTDWPSPSFQGSFLPGSSSISDNGFSAVWDVSYLSRDIPLFWKTDNRNTPRTPDGYEEYLFGVDFSVPSILMRSIPERLNMRFFFSSFHF